MKKTSQKTQQTKQKDDEEKFLPQVISKKEFRLPKVIKGSLNQIQQCSEENHECPTTKIQRQKIGQEPKEQNKQFFQHFVTQKPQFLQCCEDLSNIFRGIILLLKQIKEMPDEATKDIKHKIQTSLTAIAFQMNKFYQYYKKVQNFSDYHFISKQSLLSFQEHFVKKIKEMQQKQREYIKKIEKLKDYSSSLLAQYQKKTNIFSDLKKSYKQLEKEHQYLKQMSLCKQISIPFQITIKKNQVPQFQNLLFIMQGDFLIPFINKNIKINSTSRQAVCIYGSMFEQDQQSEDYGRLVASLIYKYIWRRRIVSIKDINKTIQTFLQHFILNQTQPLSNNKTCLIEFGNNENLLCNVSQNFNFIIYMDKSKAKELQLPFLNRFQYHVLDLYSVITDQQKNVLKQILYWVNKLLSFRTQEMILKEQNFIINCSQESITTLIVKFRDSPDRVQLIKAALLQNRTTDFLIAIRNQVKIVEECNLLKYLKPISCVLQCKKDMIVFTYDQLCILTATENIFKGNKQVISLSQISNEKNLRKQIKKGMLSEKINCLQIQVIYQTHFKHINLLLSLLNQIKKQLQADIQILVVIKLKRYSLYNLKVSSLSISYLHDFEQYFVENIHQQSRVDQIMSFQNGWQLYQQFTMTNRFYNNNIETLKLIKLRCQVQDQSELINQYFYEINSIGNNTQYRQRMQKVLKAILSTKKVNYSAIQIKPEYFMDSQNIEEAIIKYLEDTVRQIIFFTLKNIVQEGHLFFFEQDVLLKRLQPRFSDYLTEYYQQQIEVIKKIFFEQHQRSLSKLSHNFSMIRQLIIFTKAEASNIITIRKKINAIPNSDKVFKIFFKNELMAKINSLEQLASSSTYLLIKQTPGECKSQEKEYLQVIKSQFQIEKQEMLKAINKSSSLKRLFLFDILLEYLSQNGLDEADLCADVQFICSVFNYYSIQWILTTLAKDKSPFLNLLRLLSRLLKDSFTKIEAIIREVGQISKKQESDQAILQCFKLLIEFGFKQLSLTKDELQQLGLQAQSQLFSYSQSIKPKITMQKSQLNKMLPEKESQKFVEESIQPGLMEEYQPQPKIWD